jgi:predicted dehydrogenase
VVRQLSIAAPLRRTPTRSLWRLAIGSWGVLPKANSQKPIIYRAVIAIGAISSILFLFASIAVSAQQRPFRIAIAGLSHTHVHGLLSRAKDGDLEIVGIAESNIDLAQRLLERYKLPLSLVYPTLKEMLERTHPEAVAAFNPISEHVDVVRECAPRGIHVMVEKPLAASLPQAREMEKLAKQYNIHLLTNYETTWYASNYAAREQLNSLGPVRKMVAHHGHQGPKEIGVAKEFLDWLTDPVKNGGGALTDFGCYGANLFTWLMNGERPLTVQAVTQQFKPDIYPKVDDEATIVVTYPGAQGIIQASWNWPYNRKDIEVYAKQGFVVADKISLVLQKGNGSKEPVALTALSRPVNDPFAYLAAVVRGEIKVKPSDLSALENNLVVMEILEAAKESAATGNVIVLKKR